MPYVVWLLAVECVESDAVKYNRRVCNACLILKVKQLMLLVHKVNDTQASTWPALYMDIRSYIYTT